MKDQRGYLKLDKNKKPEPIEVKVLAEPVKEKQEDDDTEYLDMKIEDDEIDEIEID